MTFFATSPAASGRNFGCLPDCSGWMMGMSQTSNPEDAGVRGLQGMALQPIERMRAGPGDFVDVEENAGGREPPGRNTRRCT